MGKLENKIMDNFQNSKDKIDTEKGKQFMDSIDVKHEISYNIFKTSIDLIKHIIEKEDK